MNNTFMQLSGPVYTDWILTLHRNWSGDQVTEYLLAVRHNTQTSKGSDEACTSLAALGIRKTIAGLSIKCLRSGALPPESS